MAGAVAIRLDDIELKNWLNKIKAGLATSSGKIKTIIATIGFRDIIGHFRDEMGPDGPWKPLKETTLGARTARTKWANRRAKSGKRRHKILQDTGNLRGSLMPGRGGAQNVPGGVMLFTDVPYAAYHDSDEPRTGNLPQRSFMWMSDKALDEISEGILEEIVGK